MSGIDGVQCACTCVLLHIYDIFFFFYSSFAQIHYLRGLIRNTNVQLDEIRAQFPENRPSLVVEVSVPCSPQGLFMSETDAPGSVYSTVQYIDSVKSSLCLAQNKN